MLMMRELIASLAAGGLAFAAAGAIETPSSVADWDRCLLYDAETGEAMIDPACFLDVLIDRYRHLVIYEDTVRFVQVTERSGEEPQRVETQIGCEIDRGELRVETSASQLRRTFGLNAPLRKSPAMEDAALKYKLWLAPHMSLRFAEEPVRDFRPGIEQGFTATRAETVTLDSRPMVHLKLRSGDGREEECQAKFDLYVNLKSMLIERIEGLESLPDGASCATTLEIVPMTAEYGDPADPDSNPPPAQTEPAHHLDAAPGMTAGAAGGVGEPAGAD